jgi:hypothetical protein
MASSTDNREHSSSAAPTASEENWPQGQLSDSHSNDIATQHKNKDIESNEQLSMSTTERDVPTREAEAESPTNEKPDEDADEPPTRSKFKVIVIMFALGVSSQRP